MRKLRFSLLPVFGVVASALVVVALVLFTVGDYALVQLSRTKLHLALQRSVSSQKQLRESNSTLRSRVRNLEDRTTKVLSYEQGVRSRIDELASILKSLDELGALDSKNAPERLPEVLEHIEESDELEQEEGIGGAELDCRLGPDLRCQPQTKALYRKSSFSKNMILPKQITTKNIQTGRVNLLREIDNLTDLLRVVPLGSPGNGYVNSGFGLRYSPFNGRLKMHQGVDYALAHGSEVYSTADGVVKSVKWTRTYGLVVDIKHTNKLVTRYAHLSDVFVDEGQRVCRSQALGLVGSTGRSTGPHLHYEVRVNGRALNPLKLIELGYKITQIL